MATVIQDGIGLANDPKNSLSSVFKILEEKRYTPRIQSLNHRLATEIS